MNIIRTNRKGKHIKYIGKIPHMRTRSAKITCKLMTETQTHLTPYLKEYW
jgi:hypothetical protein